MSKGQRGFLIFVVALAFAAIFCAVVPLAILPPTLGLGAALPVIQLPGEVLVGTEEAPVITNTMIGVLIADATVLLLAFFATRRMKEVPGRLQSVFEMIAEALYNLCKSVAGDRARQLFPLMATIFILVLAANWWELFPGVDSVGIMHCARPGQTGYPRQGVLLDVRAPLGADGRVATEADYHACEALLHPEEAEASAGSAEAAHAEAEGAPLYVVTPFVRAAATDLNFTLAIALIAMAAVQVFGFRSLGWSYFNKFFNFPALGDLRKRPLGVIDFIVGLLELISEFAKIISFAFRLFGNIFAGQILLFVVAFLFAWIVPVVAYGLELFVGLIQAFVFAMLFLVFASIAMTGHGDHEEH